AFGFCSAAGFWATVFLLLWAFVLACLCIFCGKHEPLINGVSRGTVALKIMMLCHHTVVSILALVAVVDDPTIISMLTQPGDSTAANAMMRDSRGPSLAAEVLTPVTIGYMVTDLLLLSQWHLTDQASWPEAVLMLGHHTLSLISWPCAVLWDFCARYVVILLAFEVSSLFLTVNWLLTISGRKTSLLYIISGLLFTGSFVVVRLGCVIPQLLAFWQASPWLTYLSGVPAWAPPGSALLVIPHLLNLFWGVK
ncbi:unnamed protein product, partial [Polarella glacialis]